MELIPERNIGTTGIRAGAVGLGCMGMSWAYDPDQRDDDESIATIRAALDIGVTLIDTAPAYGPFTNEELVGRALAGRRDEAVLATKLGMVVDPETFTFVIDGRPEEIVSSAEASLRRLEVDDVDLMQLHRVDSKVPLEETWGAMATLVERGLVRALGLSEANVEQIELCAAIHPVASVQSELSLWTRDRLSDVVPWCAGHGAAFIAFAPLGRGFLTGTISADARFGADDFRGRNPRFTPEALSANQVIADGVRALADRLSATPAQVALAWVLAQDPCIIPIPGTRRRARVAENAAAATIILEDKDRQELDAMPAATGSRY